MTVFSIDPKGKNHEIHDKKRFKKKITFSICKITPALMVAQWFEYLLYVKSHCSHDIRDIYEFTNKHGRFL